MILQHPYFLISITAFLLNVPFGYFRQGCQKFSLKWYFWIHASIPVLIYLRITLHTSKWFIIPAVFLAVAGQIVGSRFRRSKLTFAEKETFEQIYNLRLSEKPRSFDPEKIAIVLLNMGGPSTTQDVRPFLRRVFLDHRLIRFPLASILQPFFAWLIVTIRAKATEHRYGLIGGGSPILKSTNLQAQSLEEELKKRGHHLFVTFCFNYSEPLPAATIVKLKKENKHYILPLSLYPHYSEATTGSNLFYLEKEVKNNYPDAALLHTKEYFLNDNYIQGFVDRIREVVKGGERLEDYYLLFSAHGLPLYFLDEGDPYPFQVSQTVAKIVGQLNRKDRWSISYQSAVGPMQWLKPSTDSVIQSLAQKGEHKLLVVPISFVTDHIETLCEIDIEYRKMAEDLGIKDFRMSRALECHPSFIKALADCVEDSLNLK